MVILELLRGHECVTLVYRNTSVCEQTVRDMCQRRSVYPTQFARQSRT